MTALTFGSGRAPLFGIYHAPQKGRAKRAVLLCNPFGEESIRSFRPMKKLAELLAAEGHAVLRFDYYGTGDSAGDDSELDPARMAEDIILADEELRDLSEARDIYWVALRFGAWPALEAANESKPSGLLLWEPVTNAAAYLDELGGEGTVESLGFAVTDALKGRLKADPPAVPAGLKLKLLGRTDGFGQNAIATPSSESWNSDDALNSYTVPVETLTQIRDEVSSW